MGKMKKIIILMFLLFPVECFSQIKTFYAEGSKDIKKVSLTFDDGPGKATKKILEILKENNIKATFFMLGVRVQNDPEGAKAVLASGHEIANHTYTHTNFYAYKGENKAIQIEKELLQGEKIIKDVLDVKPVLVRFPHGYAKPDAVTIAKNNGYSVINWSFGADWENMSAEEMHAKYRKAIKNGAIFLMHDLLKNDRVLSFLGVFISEIKKEGYEIVTVSELLNLKH
ncbi:polysaccharide deacetylase [Endomicrobiia bacterium]|nr:polysaccharide deacetylase [Endomicrobiia bacterium]GHT69607.1 polysaccharide deacetylase [Endomicrobiia bacterium]